MRAAREIVLPSDGERPNLSTGSLLFIGTATVLIRYAGFTILTDPNFLHQGEQVRLGYGLRSTRQTELALSIEQLPALDVVVLSHLHEDHFDRVAEQRLNRALPIVTTGHAAASLKRKGFESAQALQTWEALTCVKGNTALRVTSMPGKHAPGILKMMLPPAMGSLLEFQDRAGEVRFRLYITGDTLIHGALSEIPRRYPQIDLALLHLGGTRIFGVLLTMDARQGVEAIRLLSPRRTIPIHFNDYPVFKSPLDDFQRAVQAAGLTGSVTYLNHGETHQFEVLGAS